MTAIAGAAVASGTSLGAAAAGAASAAVGAAPMDGKYDFDTPYSRIGTDCVKWDAAIKRYGKENIVAGMGIADMDFRAAPCIGRALADRAKHENWGYMTVPDSYIEAIVNWNKRRYNLDIDPESITLTTGVHPGLIAGLHEFAPPGSKVLLTAPVYNGFYGDLRFTGTKPEDSPMKLVNGRYTVDFEDFERRISPDTNVFILCNPQNPTGNCWSPEDLLRLGKICLQHRVVVLADEIHCDFVQKGQKYTPFASLPDKDVVNNSLTFKAASKSFSLAAMKAAWFFSTNKDYVARVRRHNRADLSTLGMVANRAVLTEGEDWLDQLLPYIDANHDFAESYIAEKVPLIKYTKAQGTYLAWLDVSQLQERIGAKQKAEEASKAQGKMITPEQYLQDWIVAHSKVELNAGSSYGTGGAGHMRMNIATSRKTLELALNNIAEMVKKVNSSATM